MDYQPFHPPVFGEAANALHNCLSDISQNGLEPNNNQ